jgi:hypothetical protein
MGAKRNLYDLFKKGGLTEYSQETLISTAKVSDWSRVLRQMKQDQIITYTYNKKKHSYTITKINNYTTKSLRSGLSNKDRYRIRNRDGHRCQSCGNGIEDGVKLHVDHKIPVDYGGTNLDDNLWTLCSICNQGKKNFYTDEFDTEVMKSVFTQLSGQKRLEVLFELSPNKKFSPSVLQGISGIRDWTRTIRKIRKDKGINIQYFKKSDEDPNGYYSNIL